MTCEASIRRRDINSRSCHAGVRRVEPTGASESFLNLVRPLDLRIPILAGETVPKLVIGVPFGDVAVAFRRLVATKGLERAVAQAIEVNVGPALLQPRAGLEDL